MTDSVFSYDDGGRLSRSIGIPTFTSPLAGVGIGALTLKTYPDASSVTYSFDDGGRRTRVVDANTDNSYLYDDAGKLTLLSDAKYATPKEIAYLYDKTGARTLMDRPDGEDITYFYDARGATTLIKEGASNRAVYSFDDAGAVTKTLLGNGSYTEYSTDGVGRLTLLSNKKSDTSVISAFGYTLDPTGNKTRMTIAGSAYTSADIAYTYDDAYQLTGVVRTGGDAYAQYFYYDASGNRTKKTLGGTDTLYVYNSGDQLTSETTGGTTTTYEYDPNGALTKSDDGTTVNGYTYDYEGYLAAFDTTGTDNDATYTYDADKRRIAKVVDGTSTKFFYDAADAIADYDDEDALLATYLTPSLDGNVSVTRSGSTYYYMKDGLGSIRTLTDSSEDTQNVYDFYAFGKELGSWTEGVTNRYTYTAREWDEESAQYYYRARYYDGGGRFLSRDPVFGVQHVVPLYGYGRNCPIVYVDPDGRTAVDLVNKMRGTPVKKAWGLAGTALLQIREWFSINGYGFELGAGFSTMFFADTCEVGVFGLYTDPGNDDGLELGVNVGAGAGLEVATMKGPAPAGVASFAGVFHTIQVAPVPTLPWAGAFYFGEVSATGQQWWGGTVTGGRGFGVGLVDWTYVASFSFTLPACPCYALITLMPYVPSLK